MTTTAPTSARRPAVVRVTPRETAGQLPPHDLDAERALVACAFHAPDVLELAASKVAPGDFFSEQHAIIFRELLTLRAEGEPTDDAPTLIRRVKSTASADTVQYAARIVVDDTGYTGTIAHAERYIQSVAGMARRRRKIVAAQRAEAALRDVTDDEAEVRAAELLSEATGEVEAKPDMSAGLHIADPFVGELPAVEWVVPGLELSAGRPSVFAGYSGEGKSFAAYALAVALAAGRPIWGEFAVPRPKRVLIVDMEQGQRPTLARIRRLAKGMGLRPEQFRNDDGTSRLQVRSLPRVSLLAADAHEQVERLTAGFDLVIFDSLKKLIPGADENSAEVEAYTRKLFEVSEATQRAFLLIVHTGKAKEGRSGVSLESLRGSSAMAGDFGSTWIVTYDKASRTHTLHHAKASLDSDAGKREPVVLAFRAGEADDSQEGTPLLLEAICPEELAQRRSQSGTGGNGTAKLEQDASRIVEVLRRGKAQGEAPPSSKGHLVALAGVRRADGWAAIDEAARRGWIEVKRGSIHLRETPTVPPFPTVPEPFPGTTPNPGPYRSAVPTPFRGERERERSGSDAGTAAESAIVPEHEPAVEASDDDDFTKRVKALLVEEGNATEVARILDFGEGNTTNGAAVPRALRPSPATLAKVRRIAKTVKATKRKFEKLSTQLWVEAQRHKDAEWVLAKASPAERVQLAQEARDAAKSAQLFAQQMESGVAIDDQVDDAADESDRADAAPPERAPIPPDTIAEVERLAAAGHAAAYIASYVGLDVRDVLRIQAGGRP